MSDEDSRVHVYIGGFFALCGLMPMLGGLGVEPFSEGNTSGVPDWVPVVGGGVFVRAGLSLTLARHPALAQVVGFAAGERSCTGSFIGWWAFTRELGDLPCRVGFGWGEIVTDAFILLMAVKMVESDFGERPWLLRLKTFCGWRLVFTLLPPPLLLVVVALLTGRRLRFSLHFHDDPPHRR